MTGRGSRMIQSSPYGDTENRGTRAIRVWRTQRQNLDNWKLKGTHGLGSSADGFQEKMTDGGGTTRFNET